MNKKELLKDFTDDFKKSRGALNEIISHNRTIDATLVEDLSEGDFKKLEEHLETSRLILEATKGMTALYKEVPAILNTINQIEDKGKDEKPKLDLKSLMNEDEK